MPTYRKKPVEINAWKVSDILHLHVHQFEKLPNVIQAAFSKDELFFTESTVEIHTLEGVMTGNENDWLICGVQGELYPCKPDIFEATYDKA